MRTAMTAFLLTGVVLTLHGSAAPPGGTVAFTNVSVVPMDRDRILADQTVIVSADRIMVMGPAAMTRVPDGVLRVDGHGKYLMPGLTEMHGHVPPATAGKDFTDDVLFLYVANGVTTVRGMQGAAGQLELREAAKRGDIIAPTLYLAGPGFNAASAPTPEQAAARVRAQNSEGWDLVKVLGGLSLDAYNSMARTAKEVGIRFGGHVPSAVGLTRALAMGQDTFDHIDGYAEELNGLTDPVEEQALQDLVARTRAAGASIVPTLVVWETLRGPITLESRTTLPELRYMPRDTVQQWTTSLEKRLNSAEFNATHAQQHIDNRLRILRALQAGGVSILLGSDAPQQFNVPGFSIHREMKRMLDAGMTPYDVLTSGTANVGEHFKSKDAFGTVAVGTRADLILLDANPLEDVAHIERRSGVMVRGRWLPESEIQTRLGEIAGRHAAATSAGRSD